MLTKNIYMLPSKENTTDEYQIFHKTHASYLLLFRMFNSFKNTDF